MFMTEQERQRKIAHREDCLRRAAELEAEGRLDTAEAVLGFALRVDAELNSEPVQTA